MRLIAPVLALLFLVPGQNALAGGVNWSHFLKINPWTFEPDETRYPNHSNIHPNVIEGLIALDEPDLSPSKRMIRAAQRISEMPKLFSEQRAVLMRDALDLIHHLHHWWTAYDAGVSSGVVFYGGQLEAKEHLALALEGGHLLRCLAGNLHTCRF
jgi:hypothetical protein